MKLFVCKYIIIHKYIKIRFSELSENREKKKKSENDFDFICNSHRSNRTITSEETWKRVFNYCLLFLLYSYNILTFFKIFIAICNNCLCWLSNVVSIYANTIIRLARYINVRKLNAKISFKLFLLTKKKKPSGDRRNRLRDAVQLRSYNKWQKYKKKNCYFKLA